MSVRRIAAVGMSPRDAATLGAIVSLASGLEIGSWQCVDDAQSADVVLLDMQSSEGRKLAAQGPASKCIFVAYTTFPSVGTEQKLDVYSRELQKPLIYSHLIGLLKELEGVRLPAPREPLRVLRQVSAIPHQAADAASVDTSEGLKSVPQENLASDGVPSSLAAESDPENLEPISNIPATAIPVITQLVPSKDAEKFLNKQEGQRTPCVSMDFNPLTRLLGLLSSIIDIGKPTLLTHSQFKPLRIYPADEWFVYPLELTGEPELFRVPADEFGVEPIKGQLKDEVAQGRLPQSLVKLVYCAALFGGEGSLINRFDPDKPLQLNHKPDFHLVPHSQEHIRLANHMSQHHHTIAEISKATRIQPNIVADFCNACFVLGLYKETIALSEEMLPEQTGNLDVLRKNLSGGIETKNGLTQPQNNGVRPSFIGRIVSAITHSAKH